MAPLPRKRLCKIPMNISCSVVIVVLYFRLFMDDVEKDDVDKDEMNGRSWVSKTVDILMHLLL